MKTTHKSCQQVTSWSVFLEIEKPKRISHLTLEELECADYVNKFTSKDSSGRSVVSLPFKSDQKLFDKSFCQVERRLLTLRRKLMKVDALQKSYSDTNHDFLNTRCLEEIPSCECTKSDAEV